MNTGATYALLVPPLLAVTCTLGCCCCRFTRPVRPCKRVATGGRGSTAVFGGAGGGGPPRTALGRAGGLLGGKACVFVGVNGFLAIMF
jgi:hypothetical protein